MWIAPTSSSSSACTRGTWSGSASKKYRRINSGIPEIRQEPLQCGSCRVRIVLLIITSKRRARQIKQIYYPRLFQIFLQQFDTRLKQYITKRGRAANARPLFSLFIVLALSVKSIPALLRPQSYIISMKLQNNF